MQAVLKGAARKWTRVFEVMQLESSQWSEADVRLVEEYTKLLRVLRAPKVLRTPNRLICVLLRSGITRVCRMRILSSSSLYGRATLLWTPEARTCPRLCNMCLSAVMMVVGPRSWWCIVVRSTVVRSCLEVCSVSATCQKVGCNLVNVARCSPTRA